MIPPSLLLLLLLHAGVLSGLSLSLLKLQRGHIAISGLFLLDWNMAIIHSFRIISLEKMYELVGLKT